MENVGAANVEDRERQMNMIQFEFFVFRLLLVASDHNFNGRSESMFGSIQFNWPISSLSCK